MRKLLVAAVAAAAFAVPIAATTPAYANHTLCDNEMDDEWAGVAGYTIGVDLYDPSGNVYVVCAENVVVGVKFENPTIVVVCTYYTDNGDSTDDFCFTVQH